MLPALALLSIAPTGGEQMEMGVVVTMAAMGVDHHDVATLERLAPDLTREIIQALHPQRINALNTTTALWSKVVRNMAGTVRMMCRSITPSWRTWRTWLTQSTTTRRAGGLRMPP
jgi:hypothetical protein